MAISTTGVQSWEQILGQNVRNGQNQDSVTTGGSASAGSAVTNSQTNSSQQQNSTTNSQTQNMTPEAMAALNLLIQQLLGGGTQAMAQDRANVLQEIATNQGLRGAYGKDDAFADAQGAMAQQMRIVLERLLPSIVRGAEGAGVSQSSMRALLTQQAAQNAAEASSALGLKAAVDYGNIATGLSNVIAGLLQQKDPTAQLLINALNVAKGAVQNTQSETQTNTTGQSNTQQVVNEAKIASERKTVDYAPFYTQNPEQSSSGDAPGATANGSTNAFLYQMYGQDPWANYKF